MPALAARVAVGVAAAAALRAGVAAAAAEHQRRAQRSARRRERQFALLPREPSLEGLRRMALGSLDDCIELLGADNGALPTGEAIHEARKSLKRIRTMVRLLEDALGTAAAEREQLLLRQAGRRLAGARDAEVLVSTLEHLQAEHARLAQRPGVVRLHALLVAERERATARLVADRQLRAEAVAELRQVRGRLASWQPPPREGLEGLEQAIGRLYRSGRRRMRRAGAARSEQARAMHRWRKRVKDLRYAGEALRRRDPDVHVRARITEATSKLAPARMRRATRPGDEEIARIARRADTLGELLGEEHDLFVLRERARCASAGGGTRRLMKVIERRRKRLRKRALRRGKRLYKRRPKRMLARVRRAFRAQVAAMR